MRIQRGIWRVLRQYGAGVLSLRQPTAGKITPVSYDSVRKKNQGRKINVLCYAHWE
ncbi:MAG: hypothetical protein ABR903_02060 [Thermodesulfovibrionales bacterium]